VRDRVARRARRDVQCIFGDGLGVELFGKKKRVYEDDV
jgi:hypothetical protein